jgi:hypothetical protein
MQFQTVRSPSLAEGGGAGVSWNLNSDFFASVAVRRNNNNDNNICVQEW